MLSALLFRLPFYFFNLIHTGTASQTSCPLINPANNHNGVSFKIPNPIASRNTDSKNRSVAVR